MKKSNSSLRKHQLKFERDLTKNYWGVFSMSLRISGSIKSARPTPHSNLATSWPQNTGFLGRWQRSGTYSWAPSCSFHSFFPPHLSLIKKTTGCALPVVHACLLSGVQLCNCIDCNPPGSSVHGILQVGILEWVAMPHSRGSSQHRTRTCIFCTSRRILYQCGPYLDWGIVDWQYCASLWCAARWLSNTHRDILF